MSLTTVASEPPIGRRPDDYDPSRDYVPWLVLQVLKDGEEVESHKLGGKDAFMLGRLEDFVDIVLLHPSISRKQCLIFRRSGGIYIQDLDSAQGTFVDGQRLRPKEPHRIQHGDMIRFATSSRAYKVVEPSVAAEARRSVVLDGYNAQKRKADEEDAPNSKRQKVDETHADEDEDEEERPSLDLFNLQSAVQQSVRAAPSGADLAVGRVGPPKPASAPSPSLVPKLSLAPKLPSAPPVKR